MDHLSQQHLSASARAGLHRGAPLLRPVGSKGLEQDCISFLVFRENQKDKKKKTKTREREARGAVCRFEPSGRTGGWVGRVEMVRASKVSQQKSPAGFRGEQNDSSFDTPAKSLYTSVRELVENSLDAAERVGVLPDVSVTLEEISLGGFRR